MKAINPRNLLIGLAMIASAGLAIAMTPTIKIADQGPKLDLETLIPEQFGEWKVDENIVQIMSPDVKAQLDKIYSQTLSRTYVNTRTGGRIMLSIAYGQEQRDIKAVHYPEVCYPAQGFDVTSSRVDALNTVQGVIPLRRLETNQSERRYEPVTYWTTIGDHVSLGGIEKRLIELKYGLEGVIPDGLLFRVSSIDTVSAEAFRDQDMFVQALLQNLTPEQRSRLAGNPVYLSRANR